MDLFDEIRDDLVKTKYTHLWQKYGKYAVISAIGMILILSAYFIQQEYRYNKEEEYTGKLYNLIANNSAIYETDTSLIDNIIANAPEYHTTYAILKQVNYEMSQNNIAKSYDLLVKIYQDDTTYKPFKDFSELLLNYVICKYPAGNNFDNNITKQISTSNIFYYNIVEIKALCYIESGDFSAAKNELLQILNDPVVTIERRNFATDLLNILNKI